MSWWHFVWLGVVLVVVFGYSFLAGKRGGGGADPSIADPADPRKHWAQAAIALYQDTNDPAYWSERDAQHLIQNGWSTADRNELLELIQRYVQGECNLGFDKLRIIFLARLGRGAGWFDDATSWNYVFPAIVSAKRDLTEVLREVGPAAPRELMLSLGDFVRAAVPLGAARIHRGLQLAPGAVATLDLSDREVPTARNSRRDTVSRTARPPSATPRPCSSP
jgi:hypothetical protein